MLDLDPASGANLTGVEGPGTCTLFEFQFRETTIAVRSPVCTALPGNTPSVPSQSCSTGSTDVPAQPILRFPYINRTSWYRLACLAHHRGEHGEPLQAFLQHATYEAGARGRLRDVPRLIATYAAARGITERSAWRALKAACQRGWIRCTQHAAPGYRARYELQLPVDLVVTDLPQDLAEELGLWAPDELPEPDHTDTRAGHLTACPPVPLELAPPTPEPQRPPDAPSADPTSDSGTECQTSPSPARGSSHLWVGTVPTPGETITPGNYRQPPDHRELAQARQIIVRCRPWWRQQRGNDGVLTDHQEQELAEAVALARRRATPTQLVELMTVQCRSGRSLPHLVGHRLWRLIKTRTEWDRAPIANRPVDDRGRRHAALLTHQAAAHQRLAAGAGRVRAALAATRRRPPLAPATVPEITAARLREPEEEFRQQLAEQYGEPRAVYRARARRNSPPAPRR